MKYKNEQGIILILALMMVSILLSIALGFGIFILSDLRQAAEIDNSVVAYYAADSGIERTLYLFRHGDKDKIGGFSGSNGALSPDDREGENWTIRDSTDYELTFFRQRLYNGQSVKLYFIGRRTGVNTAKSIKINWFKGSGFSPKLQVVFTQLNPIDDDGILVYYTDTDKVEISDSNSAGPICFDFKDRDIDGSFLALPSDYVVELRVVGSGADYVDNLSVTAYNETKGINGCNSQAYNDTYNPEAISNITLKARGNYGGVSQTIYAHLPPRDPSSGLFGFVLFSEEDITKGY
ncbi:MAG: hypothetical protein A3B89_03305 [Candidatus Buchananbacteria bacterium RIFCSPHIGHO2_02_FULL_40_13]|nr:MAG: hypothetical protein A2820_01550 [Candidatus Buchananbacteria bacterium RIFCSPHIGHO2_01_FULL_40_35]OGY50216.1 MAG: hypothetical protein A3B89_03305 [Candidatus Buchananbacteria bacterium RIFCSPHIGHO2_02_FULL_40_13]